MLLLRKQIKDINIWTLTNIYYKRNKNLNHNFKITLTMVFAFSNMKGEDDHTCTYFDREFF